MGGFQTAAAEMMCFHGLFAKLCKKVTLSSAVVSAAAAGETVIRKKSGETDDKALEQDEELDVKEESR